MLDGFETRGLCFIVIYHGGEEVNARYQGQDEQIKLPFQPAFKLWIDRLVDRDLYLRGLDLGGRESFDFDRLRVV